MYMSITNGISSNGVVESTLTSQAIQHLRYAAYLIWKEQPRAATTPDMTKWANSVTPGVEITVRQMRGFRERCDSIFNEMTDKDEAQFLAESRELAKTLKNPLILNDEKNSFGRGGAIFEGDETLNERLESAQGADSLKADYTIDPETGEGEFELDLTDEMIEELRIRRIASQGTLLDEDGEFMLGDEQLKTLRDVYGNPNYSDLPANANEYLSLLDLDDGEWEVAAFDVSRGSTWLRDFPGEDAYTRNVTRVKGKIVNLKRVLESTLRQAAPIEVVVRTSENRFKTPSKGKRVIAVTPDPQIGYRRVPHTGRVVTTHDERAINVASQVIRALNPDESVNVGDYLDFAEFGRYAQESGMALVTQPSLDRGAQIARLLQLDAIMEGNHDKRILAHLMENNMALFGINKARLTAEEMVAQNPVISISNLLRLDEIGCKFIEGYPSNVYRLHPRLVMIHGNVINSAGSSAAKMLKGEPATDCVLFGHIHSREYHELSGGRDAQSAVNRWAASDGTLARIDGGVPSMKGSHTSSGEPVRVYENWQQGMSVVTVDDSDPTATPVHEPITIREGVAYFRGEEFIWSEEEVREDLRWMKDVGLVNVDLGGGISI